MGKCKDCNQTKQIHNDQCEDCWRSEGQAQGEMMADERRESQIGRDTDNDGY